MKETWISPMARIYGNLKTGKNCRIDDFVIITGDVTLGDHVHIGAHSLLIGTGAKIVIEDYAGTSVRVSLFTASDDYGSGKSLVGPCIPDKYKPTIRRGSVILQRHAHVGAHGVVLPGVVIGEGTCVGAMSLVRQSLSPWSIYVGVPAKLLSLRGRELLDLEKQFEEELANEEPETRSENLALQRSDCGHGPDLCHRHRGA